MNFTWTDDGTRLEKISTHGTTPYNWLFLPGGPGIGSEYFHALTPSLKLPGTTWHLDLPGSGSNARHASEVYDFKTWTTCLLNTLKAFENVILVGHCFGAMLPLSCLEMEKQPLKGFVIMNASPEEWRSACREMGKLHQLPPLKPHLKYFLENPSDAAFKELMQQAVPYLFTDRMHAAGLVLFNSTPLTHQPYHWGQVQFFNDYQTRWVPTVPTIILGGEKDYTTPLSLFREDGRFNKHPMLIKEIAGGSHFPWLENMPAVIKAFYEFSLLTCQ